MTSYGYTYNDNKPVVPPKGWVLLNEGETVPGVHCEYIQAPDRVGAWAKPRQTISTMIPITARVGGWVRAYAVKINAQTESY